MTIHILKNVACVWTWLISIDLVCFSSSLCMFLGRDMGEGYSLQVQTQINKILKTLERRSLLKLSSLYK